MQRLTVQPRPNWQATVEAQGFHFHSIDDKPYWDESVCYLFTAAEIDQLEAATYALNDLCLQAVQHANRFDDVQSCGGNQRRSIRRTT